MQPSCAQLHVEEVSSTQIDVFLQRRYPVLKIVAIDAGSGLVYVNPDGGGVVVQDDLLLCQATVAANENLNIYQSTKRINITGSCFADCMQASRENR